MMTTHIPSPPDMDAPIEPDTAVGAYTNCDCAFCRERRLLDEHNTQYTPHDMVGAWTLGFRNGWAAARKHPDEECPA